MQNKKVQWKQHYNFALLQGEQRVKEIMWYRCQKDAISRRKQDDSVLWRTFKQTEALKKKGESMRWYKMPYLWKNDAEERCLRFQLNHLRLSPLVTCFPLWLWTEFSPLSWCQHASINLLSFNTNIKKGIYPNPQGKKYA